GRAADHRDHRAGPAGRARHRQPHGQARPGRSEGEGSADPADLPLLLRLSEEAPGIRRSGASDLSGHAGPVGHRFTPRLLLGRGDEVFRHRRPDRRRRRGRHDVRHRGGQARPQRARHRPRPCSRRKDPHLRRRALQLHQSGDRRRQLPGRESALRPVGPAPLHPARLHQDGRSPRDRLARENAGPAVLRRQRQADHPHADGRDESGGRHPVAGPRRQGGGARGRAVSGRSGRRIARDGGLAGCRDRRQVHSQDGGHRLGL
uniref:Enoyl-CoA hydratase n=1 Tax=Parastrongyloides trichosuri TaxID=131310 RepID=A0A0N4ZXX4_PARTI